MMQLEFLIKPTANVTGFRGRIVPINLFGVCSVPATFIAQELTEHPPTRIGDGFSKTVILEHPADIQIFNPDMSILIYKLPAQLMQKVLALIGYLLMLPG